MADVIEFPSAAVAQMIWVQKNALPVMTRMTRAIRKAAEIHPAKLPPHVIRAIKIAQRDCLMWTHEADRLGYTEIGGALHLMFITEWVKDGYLQLT